MVPFFTGHHSWEQYSNFGRISDFHSVSMAVGSLELKVRNAQLALLLASSMTAFMCLVNVQSFDISTPKSLTHSEGCIAECSLVSY